MKRIALQLFLLILQLILNILLGFIMKFLIHLLYNFLFTSFPDNLYTYLINFWMTTEVLFRLFP